MELEEMTLGQIRAAKQVLTERVNAAVLAEVERFEQEHTGLKVGDCTFAYQSVSRRYFCTCREYTHLYSDFSDINFIGEQN
jgi:hypothetical protein